jgi:hypothetical protein
MGRSLKVPKVILTCTKLAWLRGAAHSATRVVILKLKLCCRSTLNGTTPKSEQDGCTIMKSVPDFDGVHTIVSLTLIREVEVDNYTICSETMHRSGTCSVSRRLDSTTITEVNYVKHYNRNGGSKAVVETIAAETDSLRHFGLLAGICTSSYLNIGVAP